MATDQTVIRPLVVIVPLMATVMGALLGVTARPTGIVLLVPHMVIPVHGVTARPTGIVRTVIPHRAEIAPVTVTATAELPAGTAHRMGIALRVPRMGIPVHGVIVLRTVIVRTVMGQRLVEIVPPMVTVRNDRELPKTRVSARVVSAQSAFAEASSKRR